MLYNMKRIQWTSAVLLGSLLAFGAGCSRSASTTSALQISDPTSPHQGLNIFRASEKEGVVQGAYVKGEHAITFASTRGEKHDWLMKLWDPQSPPYDIRSCYTSQTGDAFIVEGDCPRTMEIQLPQVSKKEASGWTRTDEFRLAIQASDELKELTFPPDLRWNQRSLVNSAANIRNEIPPQGEQPNQSYYQ
jgi:hypothetical protein